MDVELSLDEMKESLTEAGLYEAGMTRDQIKLCYQAISESKDAASDENESRRQSKSKQDVLNQKNKSFCPKNWSSKNKVVSTSTKNEMKKNHETEDLDDSDFSQESSPMETSKPMLNDILKDIDHSYNESLEDATKSCFGFHDMLECTENTLRFIPSKLELIPIQCTEIFLNADNHSKAKMLYAYHTRMNDLKAQAARKSFFAASMPHVISLDDDFNDNFDNSETKETYVSRSGRQTKRKVYYENEDSSDGVTNMKKTKNDEEEWHDKKGDKIKTDMKTTSEELYDIDKIEDGVEDEGDFEKKVANQNTKQTTGKARQRKLTNLEIMKRSSLFAESPPRHSRNDVLFDKLKEEEVKRKKQEKSIELFKQTIEHLDEENNDKIDEDDDRNETRNEIISVDVEPAIPRRVIPPIPGRKTINRRRNKYNGPASLDVKISSTASNGTPRNTPSPTFNMKSTQTELPKPSKKRHNSRSKPSEIQVENVATSSNDQNASPSTSNVECPMCGQYFPEKTIEAHAWTCSDEQPSTRSSPRSTRAISRITCEICDIVVPLNTDYEVHVKDCIKKKENESQQY